MLGGSFAALPSRRSPVQPEVTKCRENGMKSQLSLATAWPHIPSLFTLHLLGTKVNLPQNSRIDAQDNFPSHPQSKEWQNLHQKLRSVHLYNFFGPRTLSFPQGYNFQAVLHPHGRSKFR